MPPIIIGIGILVSVGPLVDAGILATVGLVNAVFGLGASLVLSGIASFFKKHPKGPVTTTDLGSSTVSVRQPAAPHRIIFGVTRVGGIITFVHTTGANNEFLHMVYTISGHQLESIDAVNFDGVAVTLNGSGDATDKYAGFVHCEFNLGSDTQTAFAGLVADCAPKWTTAHRQRGRAGVYVRLKWDATLFPSGVPNITFDVHGENRMKDHRSADATAFSQNTALALRWYLEQYLGVATADINMTALDASANTCDEAVSLKAGGTESRYTCNGSFTIDESPGDVVRALLGSMAGTLVFADGVWNIYAGAYRSTSIPTFTDDHFAGPIRWSPLASRRDICNTVRGTYVSSLNNWQPADFPTVIDATYLAADGETIAQDITLPFTTSAATAQRLAKIHLQRTRRQGQGTFPMKLTGLQAEVADVITVTHNRFGWTDKTLEVVDIKFQVDQAPDSGARLAGCVLSLKECDADIFAWTPATDETTVTAAPSTVLPAIQTAVAPTSLSVSNNAKVRADGITINRIKATWTAPADEFVTNGGHIEFQISDHADGTPQVWVNASPDGIIDGSATVGYAENVVDGHTYDARIRAVNSAGAKSIWVEVDSLAIADTTATVMSPVLAQQGSIRPSVIPAWTVAQNSNDGAGHCTVRLTCAATVIPLTDGTSFTWPATDVTWSAVLAGTTTYLFAPRYKISDGTVHWATGTGVNANADPSTVPLTSGATQAQKNQCSINQNFDGYYAGSDGFIQVTTPNNAGAGGGSSGGSVICVHSDELVMLADGHLCEARNVKPGDVIKGRNLKTGHAAFRKVAAIQHEYCSDWYRVKGHLVTPCEPFWVDGKWIPAHDMHDSEQAFDMPGTKISITIEAEEFDDHNFCLINKDTGEETVVHNPITGS